MYSPTIGGPKVSDALGQRCKNIGAIVRPALFTMNEGNLHYFGHFATVVELLRAQTGRAQGTLALREFFPEYTVLELGYEGYVRSFRHHMVM